ncbi:interactor of HORMAD1 protein 1 [Meriones unguiculatus]|uniref:interactor of HORMAD1 protein 1 n=1 Tax=Meriones unguiculatus TaxID=10047 RepID=UPI000B4ED183|nr:interactor of HORMAD1 protein 1 [Meriones unguiculatus]XP_060241249.1 interactor of HORMAD1 protein 1 [Meriones unguiculatus]XP_060241250.1 interactor of HORMAD1 protein 1 [Meriones unguiculatus]XP_060241251.1 interactor of HORMAD1 protein 1 [Meriones unguiculatus]
MNFNVWNIKEMFSIPSGSGVTKPSNWKSNQTDCSLSDSQFLFGSQFCPENSETLLASLDADVNSRHQKQTQQSSVDNEPSIFTKYQTKPQLFGGDTKDEGLFSIPLPAGKSKGLLKQFEEKKRRATDKCDSELLYNFVSHFQEVINKLQTSVEKSEKHLSSRSQSILDSLESIAETFQETARVQHDLMVEAVQEKSSMEQTILEIRKRSEARQADFIEMKSNLKNLEVLVAQQSNNFQQLCENLGQLNVPSILEELKKFASVSQVAQHLKDSSSQTSPSLAQSPHFTMQEKYPSEEPATWQAQVSLAGNPSKSFQRPGKFAGAESDGFQKAALPADGPHRGNEHVKNKIYCKNWVMTTRSLSNRCSNLPSQEVASDWDQIAQEASQLGLNKCEARVKNTCPEYETQSMFSFDSFEQSAAEQKGGTCRKGRKSKKQPSRKSKRGRYLARKQEQTPRKECAFVSKHHSSQSPVSSSQGPLLRRLAPRGSTKSACQNLEGTVKTSKAAQGNRLQSTQSFSSFQGEQQINWFTDLSLEIPEPPLFKKGGKNLLCDPDFDSSDDNL